jgi:hypothetical protein
MIFHMRTTLIIDDQLFRELKKRAAEENRTLSDVTQEVLRLGLARRAPARGPRRNKLRTYSMGRALVDVADRDQLYEVLDRS